MTDQARKALSAMIRELIAQRVRKSGAPAKAVLELPLLDAYNSTPIVDDPRVESNTSMGREVIEEFPAIWPHRDVTDDSVRLPIRLSHVAGVGFSMEIGPYDLDRADVEILKAFIASWDRIEYGPIFETVPLMTQPRRTRAVLSEVNAETNAEGCHGVGTDG
jgi:hypothetical protein